MHMLLYQLSSILYGKEGRGVKDRVDSGMVHQFLALPPSCLGFADVTKINNHYLSEIDLPYPKCMIYFQSRSKVQYPMNFVMIACEFQRAKLDAFVLADERRREGDLTASRQATAVVEATAMKVSKHSKLSLIHLQPTKLTLILCFRFVEFDDALFTFTQSLSHIHSPRT
jgi:hypothetical protein